MVMAEDIAETNSQEIETAALDGSDEGDLQVELSQSISMEKVDRSLSEFKRWHDDGELIIDPEWQRNFVWNRKQSSKLIESFLLKIPVPVVYLAQKEDGRYEVIDGLQRLKSVFDYFDNRFALTGLDIMGEQNRCYFKELPSELQRTLRNSPLRSFELSSNSSSDIHFVVFERLNSGGTKLNEMEIRNCIYRGSLNDLIKKLADDSDFKKCVNTKALDRRMHDRGLVLRFLAFYEKTHLKCTSGLKRFLNEFLDTYKNPQTQKLTEYERVFQKCMKASVTVFGDKGFRLKSNRGSGSTSVGEWTNRVNAAVFQAVATSFSSYSLGQVARNADSIYEEYLDLVTSDTKWVDFVQRTTADSTRLKYVFETWARRLAAVMESTPANDSKRVFSRELKREIYEQGRTCSLCAQEIRLFDDAVLDHETHYWRGGRTVPENARLAHRYCNASKGGH